MTPEEFMQAIAVTLNTQPNHPFTVAVTKLVKNNAQIGAYRAITDPGADAALVSDDELAAAIEAQYAGGGSFYQGYGPYARLNETVYEQVNKVLEERGIGKPPPAKPEA